MKQYYCHFAKGFRHALKQLVDISNMLCKLMFVTLTFAFALQLRHLFFRVITMHFNNVSAVRHASPLHFRQFLNIYFDVSLYTQSLRPLNFIFFIDRVRAQLWFLLRSADHGDIVVPRARSTRFGCRSFRVCGPTIWNKLPQDLRSTDTRKQFKRRLRAGYLSVRTPGGASDKH